MHRHETQQGNAYTRKRHKKIMNSYRVNEALNYKKESKFQSTYPYQSKKQTLKIHCKGTR
jgi:hypothetical protein